MEETTIIECPKIRYNISYDKNITLKDLEDIIYLIRISNNDAFQEMGISRVKGNDLQRIDRIEEGSIHLITILNMVSSVIEIADFGWNVIKYINERKQAEREKDLSGTKKDKKLYYRNELSVSNAEHGMIYIDNSYTYTINIHIHNKEDIYSIVEILK